MDDERKLDSTIQYLKVLIPEFEELLSGMERSDGWLPYDGQEITNIIESLKIEHWAEFYLDENKMHALSFAALFGEDVLKEIANDPDNTLEELKNACAELLSDDIVFPTDDEANELFNSGSEEEKLNIAKQSSLFFLTFLAIFHDCLACMIHGESLCKLVTAARDGDDEAFCKAVHIDRSILSLPFAKKRLMAAQFENEDLFLRRLAYRLKQPIMKGKIRYRTLWLTFSFLDREGLLSLPHDQLLDVCQELGVYGKEHGIEDVGHLSKRLAEYREKNRN